MEEIYKIDSPSELGPVARRIEQLSRDLPVVAFYGPMGAGKTTLIREVCRAMDVSDNVTSPTFAIINQYHTDSGGVVNHFDFYRIDTPSEAFDLGYEEYFYSGDVCFIEWPEKIESLLPQNVLSVTIVPNPERADSRTISIDY